MTYKDDDLADLTTAAELRSGASTPTAPVRTSITTNAAKETQVAAKNSKKSSIQLSNLKLAFTRLVSSKSEQVHKTSNQEAPKDDQLNSLVKASALEASRKAELAKKGSNIEEVDTVCDINSRTSFSSVRGQSSADKLVRGGHKEVHRLLQQRRFMNAKWKHLDLNWLPEQIIDFIINERSCGGGGVGGCGVGN